MVERAALEKLFDATGGGKQSKPRNWENRSGWKTNEPLKQWFGVMLNGENRVFRLELSQNGYRGERLDRMKQVDPSIKETYHSTLFCILNPI